MQKQQVHFRGIINGRSDNCTRFYGDSERKQIVSFPVRVLLVGWFRFFVLCCVAGSSHVWTQTVYGVAVKSEQAEYAAQRQRMVDEQIVARGIRDQRVLRAMRLVPRHEFVPDQQKEWAYTDGPLPIGDGQTISQPYIVALMTELAQIGPESRVLEIGTGSGYQAAILAEIAKEVYSLEIIAGLAESSKQLLLSMGYTNIEVHHADGYKGWVPAAPYDAIVVTAAPREIPKTLVDQLKTGGRMVVPIGVSIQELYVFVKKADGTLEQSSIIPVRFVPMVKKQ